MSDEPKRTLLDGSPVVDYKHREIDPRTGMQKDYIVLSADERAKGFVRPVRRSYVHAGIDPTMDGPVLIKVGKNGCGTRTTMGVALAETYARDPKFYSGTFCCGCRTHFPVGESGEFVWEDGQKVGT